MRLPPGWGFLLAALVWGAGGLLIDRDDVSRQRGPSNKYEQPRDQVRPPPLRPQTQEEGDQLPAISVFDPEINVRSKSSGGTTVGTAFPVSNNGVWLTARHVVDDCKRVAIFTNPAKRKGFWVQDVYVHPKADIAVIRTTDLSHPKRRPPAIAVRPLDEALSVGQAGFHFGYPMGRPGDLRSTLIGRRKMRKVGSRAFVEPGIAWAVSHQEPRLERLGGMSGGPVLDRQGRVIGVTVAGNIRRGRVLTSPPLTIHQTLRNAGARLDGAPSAGLSQRNLTKRDYPIQGDNLRRQVSVAKVLCSAKG